MGMTERISTKGLFNRIASLDLDKVVLKERVGENPTRSFCYKAVIKMWQLNLIGKISAQQEGMDLSINSLEIITAGRS
jgi:hypothetical protein